MRTRSKARLRAVEALFEADQRQSSAREVLDRNPEGNDYARTLVQAVADQAPRIDELISTFAQAWPLERMPAVDRAILRMAVAELLVSPEVETPVVISEAVELATSLGTDESAAFVNGVLSSVGATRAQLAGH